MWKNPPASVYRKYYFFDVQNPEEILAGEKPYVVERGPYAYKVSNLVHTLNYSNTHGVCN